MPDSALIVHKSGVRVKQLPIVFVLNDNTDILIWTEATLKSQGLNVKSFSSIAAFITDPTPKEVGCILIDVLMSSNHAVDLFRWLQATGSLLSVVIVTGLIDAAARSGREAAKAGSNEKSPEVATLLTMVADGVAGSLSRQAVRELGGKTG
jgi:FixJ family two-component response regulator